MFKMCSCFVSNFSNRRSSTYSMLCILMLKIMHCTGISDIGISQTANSNKIVKKKLYISTCMFNRFCNIAIYKNITGFVF